MYLLDANTFMEASRLYYGFDTAPGFWTWISAQGDQVGSIRAVKDEIAAGTGELVTWAQQRPDRFWASESDAVVSALRDLADWAVDPGRQYRQEAITEFLDSADYELIAHALAFGATVVTRERPAPESRKKIKIPDACDAFKVPWTDPFSLYRNLGMRLISGQ